MPSRGCAWAQAAKDSGSLLLEMDAEEQAAPAAKPPAAAARQHERQQPAGAPDQDIATSGQLPSACQTGGTWPASSQGQQQHQSQQQGHRPPPLQPPDAQAAPAAAEGAPEAAGKPLLSPSASFAIASPKAACEAAEALLRGGGVGGGLFGRAAGHASFGSSRGSSPEGASPMGAGPPGALSSQEVSRRLLSSAPPAPPLPVLVSARPVLVHVLLRRVSQHARPVTSLATSELAAFLRR